MSESEFLKKLESIIQSNKDEQSGNSKSWIATIVIFFVVLIGIIAFAWIANRNAKELAQLRHDKNKQKIEEDNLKVEQEATKNDVKKSELQLEIDKATNEVNELEKKIAATEKAHQENLKRINSITSWRDLIDG